MEDENNYNGSGLTKSEYDERMNCDCDACVRWQLRRLEIEARP